jgi:antitoxin component YwqK of YwqJK toxin-antitoxin module
LIRKEPYIADIKHGNETEFFNDSDNNVKLITPYSEGVKDGLAKEFDREGKLITLTIYRHGFIKSKEKINRSNALGKQGTWKEFYENDQLAWEKRYKNDVLNGYFKRYDANGRLLEAVLYIDGVAQKESDLVVQLEMKRSYHPNGQLEWEGGYDLEGNAHGPHVFFDEKGKIIEVKVFERAVLLAKGELNEDGQRIGYWEEYYFDGKIKAKGKYKNGIKVGEWNHYYDNGEQEQLGKYNKDGKPTGLWVWYYENGNILREENFRKGLEDGSYVEYSRSGKVITKGDFLDGRKEGIWVYEMGDYREEGNYRDDRKEGVWKYYYNDGTLLFIGEYIDGNPEGKHRYYYSDGILKREENYSVGEPSGVWKSYTSDGELFLTAVYRNGKEYKLDNRKLKD